MWLKYFGHLDFYAGNSRYAASAEDPTLSCRALGQGIGPIAPTGDANIVLAATNARGKRAENYPFDIHPFDSFLPKGILLFVY